MSELSYGSIECPKVGLAELSIFIADDSQYKVDDMLESLREQELIQEGERNITIKTTLKGAREYIEEQKSGSLDHNVWIFDGSLDDSESYSLSQGRRLHGLLFSKYTDSLRETLNNSSEVLRDQGLTESEVSQLLMFSRIGDVATKRFTSEALSIGVSRVEQGGLDYPAQLPHLDHKKVGEAIFMSMVPAKERKRIIGRRVHLENLRNREAALAARKSQEA